MVKINLPDKTPSPATGVALTKEQQSKGGKTETVWRSLGKALAKRKHCSPTCKFFEACPVNGMSMGYIDKAHPEKSGMCMMKEFPLTVRQQFINMFLSGEEGIIKTIKDAFHLYQMEVQNRGSLKDQRDMIALLIQFYEKVYVNPRGLGKGMAGREPLTITIRRIGTEPETITVKPNEPLPKGLTVDDILHPQNEDETTSDPESLMLSPMMDNFLRRRVVAEEIKIEVPDGDN